MKDPRVYLAQIFECIERIEEFTAAGQAEFLGNRMMQVWGVIERELPPVKSAIASLLPPLDQLEAELAGEEPATNQ